MRLAAIFGATVTVIGLVRAAPQLIKLLRRREAFGVSPDTAATSSIVSFGWVVYGLWTHQRYVSLASGATALIFAGVFLAALGYGRSLGELRVAPAWLAVLAAAGAFAGRGGLGFVLPLSVLAANLPQVRVARREADLSGLSLGTWLLSMSEGLLWGLYALAQRDVPILFFGVFQLATSGWIVALKLASAAARRPGAATSAEPRAPAPSC